MGNKRIRRIPNILTKSPIPILDVSILTTWGTSATFALLNHLGVNHTELYNTLEPIRHNLDSIALYGMYLAFSSGLLDFISKRGIKKFDFRKKFGVWPEFADDMPLSARQKENSLLVEKLNDEYCPEKVGIKELAKVVNSSLTNYILDNTGEEVRTSDRVRKFGVSKLLFPFASGAYNPLGGDIYMHNEIDIFGPHILTHEFAHRKGYGKELEAQLLAYFSLKESGINLLSQSADSERLFRNIQVLNEDRMDSYEFISDSQLRPEIKEDFKKRCSKPGIYENVVGGLMLPFYKLRMKLTGQDIEDYDKGFTNYLYAIENKN